MHPVWSQSFSDHHWTKIRPTNTDIHNVGNRLTGHAPPFASANRLTQCFHFSQLSLDLGHHILAIDIHWLPGHVSQCRMKHRTVLRMINRFPGEHLFNPTGQVSLLNQTVQQLQGLLRYPVFGKIQQNIIKPQGKLLETSGIIGEHITHV